MRFESEKVGGYQIFAASGTNTVSFGIDFDRSKVGGLLAFEKVTALPSAAIAILDGGKPGPTIALRRDMDARSRRARQQCSFAHRGGEPRYGETALT